jgi:hypothetical protein
MKAALLGEHGFAEGTGPALGSTGGHTVDGAPAGGADPSSVDTMAGTSGVTRTQ